VEVVVIVVVVVVVVVVVAVAVVVIVVVVVGMTVVVVAIVVVGYLPPLPIAVQQSPAPCLARPHLPVGIITWSVRQTMRHEDGETKRGTAVSTAGIGMGRYGG
jgi:hypothetical protein